MAQPKVIRVKAHMSKAKVKATYEGKLVSDEDYDSVVNGDTDVYDADNGQLLFKFRKRVIPEASRKLAHSVYDTIDTKMPPSMSRNKAAGPVSLERWQAYRDDIDCLIPVTATTAKIKLKNGHILARIFSNPVRSYIAGYNYWRWKGTGLLTGFSKKYPNEWQRSVPFFADVYKCLKREMPEVHKIHEQRCNQHRKFTIANTNLTTVAINVNYESSYHLDVGDLDNGFSTLTVLEVGQYDGGNLVFPRYRIAVNVREGDVILNQSHKIYHGNSPIHCKTPGAKRISFVTYLKKLLARARNK